MSAVHPLSLRGLRAHLVATWPDRTTLQSPSGDRWLAVIGLTGLVLAGITWLIGGAHTGFHVMNSAMASLPDGFWGMVTSIGDGFVLAALALFFARRHPHILWIIFLGVFIGGILTHGPKELLDMPRPAGVLDGDAFHLVGPGHRSKGPPSGHTLAVFMLAGIGIYLIRRLHWRVLLLTGATLVAFSRVAVGEHWPFDVFLGVAAGALGAWLSVALARAWPAGRNVWVHLALLALFVTVAVYLLTFDPPYPLGHELNIVVGACALLAAARDYLFDPLRRV